MVLVKSLLLCAFLVLVSAESDKVKVEFYGESLCPDCTGFTTKILKPIFSNGISLIANFSYYGWGNVFKQGSEYKCQHGPLECTMNTVLNCGQNVSANQDQFFHFLYCIESQVGPDVESQIPGCAKAAGLSLKKIEECYKGDKGEELDRKAHEQTDDLSPPHTYVPWVVVDGQPIFEDVDSLGLYICAAYKGKRPQACAESPLSDRNDSARSLISKQS